jgi:hypothetical protein
LVLLIRRTVRPKGYASALHSLRPCWTACLSILREHFSVVPHALPSKFSRASMVFHSLFGRPQETFTTIDFGFAFSDLGRGTFKTPSFFRHE